MTRERRIGLILFDGCDLLDLAGPADVFATAARKGGVPYKVEYLSPAGGLVATWEGLKLETVPLSSVRADSFDTIIVVGGLLDDTNCDLRIVEWIEHNHQYVRRLGSVCTGAFFLARAGLLEGKKATTHWEDCAALQAHFPAIDVDRNSIFVCDGAIWTSAGITAGIDMALAMIEEDHGRDLALAVARNLVVFLKRPGGQSQFSTHLECQVMEGPLTPLLKWIIEHPEADMRAEALAERANMSLRSFYRAFEDATGTPPAQWIETVRLGTAKRLLEQTDERVDQIARKAGFVTYEKMRRCFARHLAVTPAAYRERFALSSPRATGPTDPTVLHKAFGLVDPVHATLQ